MPIVLGKIESLIVRLMIGFVDGPPSNNEILYNRADLREIGVPAADEAVEYI